MPSLTALQDHLEREHPDIEFTLEPVPLPIEGWDLFRVRNPRALVSERYYWVEGDHLVHTPDTADGSAQELLARIVRRIELWTRPDVLTDEQACLLAFATLTEQENFYSAQQMEVMQRTWWGADFNPPRLEVGEDHIEFAFWSRPSGIQPETIYHRVIIAADDQVILQSERFELLRRSPEGGPLQSELNRQALSRYLARTEPAIDFQILRVNLPQMEWDVFRAIPDGVEYQDQPDWIFYVDREETIERVDVSAGEGQAMLSRLFRDLDVLAHPDRMTADQASDLTTVLLTTRQNLVRTSSIEMFHPGRSGIAFPAPRMEVTDEGLRIGFWTIAIRDRVSRALEHTVLIDADYQITRESRSHELGRRSQPR